MEKFEMKNDVKILIVDDDPINIRNASRILKDDYKIMFALSGQAALNLMRAEVPDLVLLDLHMPEMNGFDVIDVMKKTPEWAEIPIVLLTADNDRGTEAEGLKRGALDFITKPFLDEIVKQRVKRLVELNHLQKQLQTEVEKQTRKAEERRMQVEELSFQTVHALADAIDAKDKYTNGHSGRVSAYATILAEALGWESDQVNELRYAALLHDVGKIGVPDVVLNKPGKLTDIEFDVIKAHTTIGADILKNITTVEEAHIVAAYHHERYDGKGYPNGLKGDEIPEIARIVCIADAYDAMSSKRVYRNALKAQVIREELVNGSGSQFDPSYLEVFLKLFDDGKLNLEGDTRDEEGNRTNGSSLVSKYLGTDDKETSDTDPMTGLLMRNAGERMVGDEMLRGSGFLAVMDVDNLKKVNDLHGYKYGDDLLMKLGDAIRGLGEGIYGCRSGGDEMFIFGHVNKASDAAVILDKLYADFDASIKDEPAFEENSISAGVVLCQPTDMPSDIFTHADNALYYAKQTGKRHYHFYQRHGNYTGRNENIDLKALVENFRVYGEYKGAMSVDYHEFAQIFEYIRNMEKRYEHEVQLVMITLNTEDVGSIYIERIEEAVTAMERSIRNTIRTVDVCTRYSNLQFLVILMGTNAEEVPIITERIFNGFYKSYADWNIRVSYASEGIDSGYKKNQE
ncbi:MAG: response regulator [Lachnospiraceae bacterium]|nr:response regulator [Candidatus Merdinaster equi]